LPGLSQKIEEERQEEIQKDPNHLYQVSHKEEEEVTARWRRF
jgi:hypothetical protein